MASSNIKLFDENKGNMLNDTEFNISTQRLNGLQTGVASSQLQNKAMYQASLMAYAIAQLMLANGQNANDTDAVSTFVNNLSASIVQKKLDKATKQDVADGTVGKWISSELLKSNNEAIDAKKANVEDVTALRETVAALAAGLGSGGHNCRIAWGSYTGDGKSPTQASPKSLSCGFYPLAFIIFYNGYPCLLIRGQTTLYDHWGDSATVTWNDSGLSWYVPSSRGNTFNNSGTVYNYLFLGYDKNAETAG